MESALLNTGHRYDSFPSLDIDRLGSRRPCPLVQQLI